MILLVHLLFGALIGEKILNPFLAIILALLGHYLLDVLPHVDYSIEIRSKKQLHEKLFSILKLMIDIFSGILLILVFSKNQPLIYICAFFAILPDGLTVWNNHIPNKILGSHNKFHTGKIHFLRHKKISNFWRITTQVGVVIACIILFKI